MTKNKQSFTPLAAAAFYGAAAAAPLLLQAHAAALSVPDKHGFTPSDLAERRGHRALAELLRKAAAAAPDAAVGNAAAAAEAAGSVSRQRTLIVAPPECELHRTCPDPLPRGIHPPPENVDRIHVLVHPGRGILQSRSFEGRLSWETSVPPAPIADVLRVHDWNYVRGLQVDGWIACQAMACSYCSMGSCYLLRSAPALCHPCIEQTCMRTCSHNDVDDSSQLSHL